MDCPKLADHPTHKERKKEISLIIKELLENEESLSELVVIYTAGNTIETRWSALGSRLKTIGLLEELKHGLISCDDV
jgi:hypothetical protein